MFIYPKLKTWHSGFPRINIDSGEVRCSLRDIRTESYTTPVETELPRAATSPDNRLGLSPEYAGLGKELRLSEVQKTKRASQRNS